jgi:hypothetical protein
MFDYLFWVQFFTVAGDEKEEILSFDHRDRMLRIFKNEEFLSQFKYEKFERLSSLPFPSLPFPSLPFQSHGFFF